MNNIHRTITLSLLLITVWTLFYPPGKAEAESIHFETMDTSMAEEVASEPDTILEPGCYARWELSDNFIFPAPEESATILFDNFEPATEDALSTGDLSHPPTFLSKPEIILLFGTSITGVVWIGFRRKKKVFDPAPQRHL